MTETTDSLCAVPATAEELTEARAWLKDCDWGNLDPDDIDEMTDAVVYCAISRYYDGGWPAFRLALPCPPDTGAMELTLYRILAHGFDGELLPEADDGYGPGVLILGRDAAERFAGDLLCNPETAVSSVLVSPIEWDSQAEQNIILGSGFNGIDLHTPMAAIADQRGVDYDPDNFDPAAMLIDFRAALHA